MDKTRKKIGIMGGTFDPIHYGHLMIAENAADQYQLDEVWFMPNGHAPHKENSNISNGEQRCDMIRLAIGDNSKFLLSRFEMDSNEINYSYRTMEKLTELYPEFQFYFIIGGDSLKKFETWCNPGRILQLCYVLAAVRDEVDGEEFWQQIQYLSEKYDAKGISPLYNINTSVSSRKIRELVFENKTIRYMVPENVRQYIIEQDLYRAN